MQGVSALKGLEGPFLFGAMGPLPAGAAPLGRAARRLPDLLASGQPGVSVRCLGARLPL